MTAATRHLDSLEIRPVDRSDHDSIQRLFLESAEYIQLITGATPDPFEAERLLDDLPPGRSLSDKTVLGIYNKASASLVGVVDAVMGYPRPDILFLGLLLLTPKWRGMGAGPWILTRLIAEAAASDTKEIHLAVAPINGAALRFWRREGFREIRLSRQAGVEDPITVVVMARQFD